MSQHRHSLDDVPGSEATFNLINRHDAQTVQAMAHLMLALTADTTEGAHEEMKAAEARGVEPRSWAGWAVISGAQHALRAMTERGIQLEDAIYKGRPVIEWTVLQDRADAVRALVDLGFSPTSHLAHVAQAPSWLEFACAERGFSAANALLDMIPADDDQRQDILDRALLALSLCDALHGHNHQREDPERWMLWTRLVKEGANPFRCHAPGDDGSQESIEHWWTALSEEAREDWKSQGQPACSQAPIHHVLRYLAATRSEHNPDIRVAWKALDATIDWARLPADGWGRGARSMLMGSGYPDRGTVCRELLQRKVGDGPGCSVVDAYLLDATREYARKGRGETISSSSCLAEWSRWSRKEENEGRPSSPTLASVHAVALMALPTRQDLASLKKTSPMPWKHGRARCAGGSSPG